MCAGWGTGVCCSNEAEEADWYTDYQMRPLNSLKVGVLQLRDKWPRKLKVVRGEVGQ